MSSEEFEIGGRKIGWDHPCFIIGEAGVNHGGDMDLARKLVDLAAEAGCDAVKFQFFSSEHLILKDVEKAGYQKVTTDAQESQFEMLKKLEMTLEQTRDMKAYTESKGLIFMTTAFDEYSLHQLDDLDLPAYKVASTDTTNLPFLDALAGKHKPVILSTGMSYLSEVELAVDEIRKHHSDLVVLHCTGNYPFHDSEANLKAMITMGEQLGCLVGYSDHSEGVGASPYAVAMGAKVVEKHFTLDKTMEGPDHKASLSPEELKDYVQAIRKVEEYLGDGIKRPTISEQANRNSMQKCLVATRSIKAGEIFSAENIIAKRTGGRGINPIYYHQVVGKPSSRDYRENEIIERP